MFVILAIFVGGMFVLNVFISVAIDEYKYMKEFNDSSVYMTDAQKQWANNAKQILLADPPRYHPRINLNLPI